VSGPGISGDVGRDHLDRDDDDIRPFSEAGGPARAGRAFQRNRLRLGLVIAAVAGAIAFLLLQGLGSATTYFRNADEAVADRSALGTDRFPAPGHRRRGLPPPGRGDRRVHRRLRLRLRAGRPPGDPPELFKEGIPVVLEGSFPTDAATTYESDRILVRHTSEYRTEESDRLALAAEEQCPGATGAAVGS
jgi:cytochrome c-type biogenesis protein CcmE